MIFPGEIRPEAKIRKPSPDDLKKIFEAETFTDMWHIPLFKVVLVAVLANVGSTLGTILYFIVIFPTLGIDPAILILQGFGNMWQGIMGLIH
jgi:pheromone shutdown protein TraB